MSFFSIFDFVSAYSALTTTTTTELTVEAATFDPDPHKQQAIDNLRECTALLTRESFISSQA
jgi:hypothetical protein